MMTSELVGRVRRAGGRALRRGLLRGLVRLPLRDPVYEHGLCLLTRPDRLSLPSVELADLFDAPIPPITIEDLPQGRWSSPVADMVAMCRLVAAVQPRHALELGSFRGFTAVAMARHLGDGGRLVTVDIDPAHGSAYVGTPLAGRIDRRVGTLAEATASDAAGTYDLVLIDADHRHDAVRADTEAILPLLAPDGWLLWHDYANWGYYSEACGVPEYLTTLADQIPVVHLAGTALALHRPSWAARDRAQLDAARAAMTARDTDDVWQTGVSRA